MRYKVIYTLDEDGVRWNAEIPELPGCCSWGESLPAARRCIREALELFLNVEPGTLDVDEEVFLPVLEKAAVTDAQAPAATWKYLITHGVHDEPEVLGRAEAFALEETLMRCAGQVVRESGDVTTIRVWTVTNVAIVPQDFEIVDLPRSERLWVER